MPVPRNQISVIDEDCDHDRLEDRALVILGHDSGSPTRSRECSANPVLPLNAPLNSPTILSAITLPLTAGVWVGARL